MKINKFLYLAIMAYFVQISAIPEYVMIIRHGELTPEPEATVDFTGWHLKPIHLFLD